MFRHVVCYDVGDDARRYRVHKLLSSYGEAVEESVFEVMAAAKTMRELRGKLRKLVDAQVDVVRVYRLCQRCERDVDIVVGPPKPTRRIAHIL